MRTRPALLLMSAIALAGCYSSNNPDALQQNTANATAAAKRDAGAIAKGVVEGLRRKGPIDINHASKEQLMTLPEVNSDTAQSIISGRPYTDAAQLLHRHILSRPEYDRIHDQIFAGR